MLSLEADHPEPGSGRAMGLLTKAHLSHLSALAAQDREGLFARCPHLAFYRERLLCVALCQGGALHYVDGCNGVKDLDVWSFYGIDPFSWTVCGLGNYVLLVTGSCSAS